MAAIKRLFNLKVNFPQFRIRENWARVKKKLCKLKNGIRNNPEPQIEEQPAPERTPLLRDSATAPVPQKCQVVVGGTLRPGAIRHVARPSSIPPANPPPAPGTSISDDGLFIKNVEFLVADGSGEKECRRAKLDTAASVSIMSKDVQRDLRHKLEPCDELIKPFNSQPIKPLGVVKGVEWNFTDGARTYIEDFYVFETEEFDTLIGKRCLGENGILKFNSGEPLSDAD